MKVGQAKNYVITIRVATWIPTDYAGVSKSSKLLQFVDKNLQKDCKKGELTRFSLRKKGRSQDRFSDLFWSNPDSETSSNSRHSQREDWKCVFKKKADNLNTFFIVTFYYIAPMHYDFCLYFC